MIGRDQGGRFTVVSGGRRGGLALADEPTLLMNEAPPAVAPVARSGLVVAGAMGGGVVLGAGAVLVGLGAAAAVVVGLLVGWSTASAPGPVAAAPEVVGVPVVLVVPAPPLAAEPVAAAAPVVEASAEAPAAEPIEIVARAPAAEAPRRAPTALASVPAVWWRSPSSRPSAPAAAAEPAPVQPSSLRITTDPPGAHVVVDDVWRGRAPSALELRPGRHRLLVEDGRASGTFVVDASAGHLCYAVDGSRFVATDCR